MSKFCPNCRATLQDNATQCLSCGAQFADSNSTQHKVENKPLVVNKEAQGYMETFSQWVKITCYLSIITGIVSLLISIIAMVQVGNVATQYGYAKMQSSMTVAVIISLVSFVLMLILYLRAIQGAKNFQLALKTKDERYMANGLNDFRFIVKFIGILLIILLVLMILLMIIGVLAASTMHHY